MPIDGWHFATTHLRDGSPLPRAGDVSQVIVDPVPCRRGWHVSVRAIDALRLAPGPYVARVRLLGEPIAHGDPVDKYVSTQRETLTDYVDSYDVLRAFACRCALDVIHLWDAPDVVREFLATADASYARDAVRAAHTARASAADEAAADAADAAAYAACVFPGARAAHTARASAAASAAAYAAADVADAAVYTAAENAQNEMLTTMLRELIDA